MKTKKKVKAGNYKNHNYEIFELSIPFCSWRVAYIEVKENSKYFEKDVDDLDEIICNGGITFSAYKKDGKFYIGFDTNHSFNDFKENDNDFMESECKKIIEQLIE